MLQVEPYDWSDVEGPTDEELAEVDAAREAAPSVPDDDFYDAWMASYPVKKAVEVVGLPNGTARWLIDFTAELFAQTEAIAPYRERAHLALYHATAWHVRDETWKGGTSRRLSGSTAHLRALVELMPIEATVQYVSEMRPYGGPVTVEDVEDWLFPCLPLDKAREALALVRGGVPGMTAAQRVGIDYCDGLQPFLKAHHVDVQTVGADGRRWMSSSLRAHILALAADGAGAKEVHDLVLAEGHDVGYDAVKAVIRRGLKAAA